MMRRTAAALALGFTLVELMIVVALSALVLMLAAPSFRNMIELQRLRSLNSQMVTDIQMARSEAVSRQDPVTISFGETSGPNGMSCYTIHTCGTYLPAACSCDCTAAEGSRCPPDFKEVRTQQVPLSLGVKTAPVLAPNNTDVPNRLRFDPVNGAMKHYYIGVGASGTSQPGEMWIDTSITRSPRPTLRTMVSIAGRPSVCTRADRRVSGVPTCP